MGVAIPEDRGDGVRLKKGEKVENIKILPE